METQKNKPRGKPFEPGNAGKPVGAVSKKPKMIKEWFYETFQALQEDETDPAHLSNWSKANPTEFYRLSSKLLPIQIAGDPENPIGVNVAEGMTFEQLYQLKYGKKPE